jgi:hypothetical protein
LQCKVDHLNKINTESKAFDIIELKEKSAQMETKLILAQFNHEKDQIEIKKMHEALLQKLNTYKLTALNKTLQEKQAEIHNLALENSQLRSESKSLQEKIKNKDLALQGLHEKEDILSSIIDLNISTVDGIQNFNNIAQRARVFIENLKKIRASLI